MQAKRFNFKQPIFIITIQNTKRTKININFFQHAYKLVQLKTTLLQITIKNKNKNKKQNKKHKNIKINKIRKETYP